MPRAAIALGGATHVVALNRIAGTIVKCLERAAKTRVGT
jgi:chemotaxis response regulator CheB